MKPRKLILLADDNESSLSIEKMRLETQQGCQVVSARSIYAMFEILKTIKIGRVMLAFKSEDVDLDALADDIRAHFPSTEVVMHERSIERVA